MTEPTITINGHVLSEGQAMAIRVAIENFASSLASDGLGDDEHGKRMVMEYLKRIQEIRGMIFSGKS